MVAAQLEWMKQPQLLRHRLPNADEVLQRLEITGRSRKSLEAMGYGPTDILTAEYFGF